MILGQLRMGARQTIYAPLTADWKNYSQEQVAPANPLWGGCVQLKVPIWLSPRLISWFDCPFQSPPNGESVRSSSFCTRVSLPTVSFCRKSFLPWIVRWSLSSWWSWQTRWPWWSLWSWQTWQTGWPWWSFFWHVSLPTVICCTKKFSSWDRYHYDDHEKYANQDEHDDHYEACQYVFCNKD